MKIKSLFLIIILVVVNNINIFSQNFENSIEYLKFIQERDQQIVIQLWDYIRVKAHSQKQKKIDKSKTDLIDLIHLTTKEISQMPSFNGNPSLRDSMVAFFKLYENIISGDYAEIEALEFESQKSYSAMRKYLNKIDATNNKIAIQRSNVMKLYENFALENNIDIISEKSELEAKMKLTNIVNEYYNNIYLIYFKNFVALSFLSQSINNSDTIQFDMWKDSVFVAFNDGLTKIKKINAYNNDNSLKQSCIKSLHSAKLIYEKNLKPLRNYFTTKSIFEKTKSKIDNTPKSDLKQEEITSYNDLILRYNKSVLEYNQNIQKFNNIRNEDNKQWNLNATKFLDTNIPK